VNVWRVQTVVGCRYKTHRKYINDGNTTR